MKIWHVTEFVLYIIGLFHKWCGDNLFCLWEKSRSPFHTTSRLNYYRIKHLNSKPYMGEYVYVLRVGRDFLDETQISRKTIGKDWTIWILKWKHLDKKTLNRNEKISHQQDKNIYSSYTTEKMIVSTICIGLLQINLKMKRNPYKNGQSMWISNFRRRKQERQTSHTVNRKVQVKWQSDTIS